MTEKLKINVVLEDDLLKILKSKGLLNSFIEGKIKCVNCEKIIQISNISSIHVLEGKLTFHCDSDQCLNTKQNDQC